VKTFAVGFGGGVDAGELNDIATEGGHRALRRHQVLPG
jgi:hypothetical protein